jgi:hypothetical protein
MPGPAASTRPARSYKAAADILSERDPVLRRLIAQAGPVRVNPPAETHFAALVHAILYQQLTGEGWHRGAIEPLLVIHEADRRPRLDLPERKSRDWTNFPQSLARIAEGGGQLAGGRPEHSGGPGHRAGSGTRRRGG